MRQKFELSCDPISKSVNLSTPSAHVTEGLPFDKLKAPSAVEGLEIHPEPRSSTPTSKVGLRAAERVKPLKVDLHIHTAEDPRHQISYTAKDLISIAADEGYDVLAITNHQCLTFSKKLSAYARERGILLIPGVEVTLRRKHVVLLNPPPGRGFPDFSSLSVMQRPDALVIAPHPYFPNPFSLNGLLVKHLEYFDAIEYCHFYSPGINFNHMALKVSQIYGVPVVGNSDAHFLSQLGTTYSLIHAEKDPESIFHAIREGHSEVVTRPLSPLEMGAILGKFAGMKLLVEKNKRRKWLASRLGSRRLKLPLSSTSRSRAA